MKTLENIQIEQEGKTLDLDFIVEDGKIISKYGEIYEA